MQATCGTLALSTATVKLIAPDGEEKIACSVANKLINPSHTAFMSGRIILEGIIVFHETIHELQRKK